MLLKAWQVRRYSSQLHTAPSHHEYIDVVLTQDVQRLFQATVNILLSVSHQTVTFHDFQVHVSRLESLHRL